MNIKTLISINTDFLINYKQIENLNPDNWDIISYLNLKYDMNSAIAFSKLFFPDFIEKNGCILLGFKYNEVIFNQWFEHFKGDIPEVERICNYYEVMDFFHLNRPTNHSEDFYNNVIDQFARILKKIWEVNLILLFPGKEFEVLVYDEYNTTRITIYSCSSKYSAGRDVPPGAPIDK